MTNPVTQSPAEVAVLGGGCFWCLDAVYRGLDGVLSVQSGYAGGRSANPSYDEVCSGRSGHAEVVKLEFDPARVSYRDLLRIFFTIHDPTTRDRQGNDIGSQYRSVIFAQTPEQAQVASEVMREITAEQLWPAPLVTELGGAVPFYAAENYHQDYFDRNRNQPYCAVVVAPKVAKFRKQYSDRLKPA